MTVWQLMQILAQHEPDTDVVVEVSACTVVVELGTDEHAEMCSASENGDDFEVTAEDMLFENVEVEIDRYSNAVVIKGVE